MADSRIEALARVLVEYSVAVKPGEKVLIQGSAIAEPLLKEIYARVLRAGGYPLMMLSLPGAEEIFFRDASEEQLKHVAPPVKLAFETYDVRITILAESNTRALSKVDPARMVTQQRARTELMKIFMTRAARGELRWTLAPFPTNASAQEAEMGLGQYEDFVYGACVPDTADPVGYWRRFSARQQKTVDWLKGRSEVRLTGDGTDLKFSVAGRTFINCDGHENMPDGEVFTGPIEDTLEGRVTFSYPALYGGREVSGVRLWFEKGGVVKATAEKNEAFLNETLNTDAGARYVGEFGIGTNEAIQTFTREILFDEKIGGSFHLAVGAGYPETGSKNESAVHWDMICDLRVGGEIRVDGQSLYRNGKLAISI